jgi:ubiquinone/menaquinone biosynthesis C-methylase UbiE
VKTQISSENPLAHSRRMEQAYTWERLRILSNERGSLRLLDFGTHDGEMLHTFATTGIVREAIGLDVDSRALESREKRDSVVKLHRIAIGESLPFPDSSFDAVTLIGVLEHIYRQDSLLAELYRVLEPDGSLIVSVPGQHLFSFLDLGNLKFRFPRLHRLYYTRRHGHEEYLQRYVEGENGLIGDIEAEKGWHEHFSYPNLERLLRSNGFQVVDADGFGLFFRLIHNLWTISPVMKDLFHEMMLRDMRTFEMAEIFVECRKSMEYHSAK